jgi:ketosteroid isomerase-like protein
MVLFLALTCATSPRGWSQDPDNAASRIVALENTWSRAAAAKDLRALDALLDDSFVYINFDGRVLTKTAVMADVTASTVQQFVTSEMVAHFYGNVTIVTGVFKLKGIDKGKAFQVQGRFTDTWIHKSRVWVCVASQSNSIKH